MEGGRPRPPHADARWMDGLAACFSLKSCCCGARGRAPSMGLNGQHKFWNKSNLFIFSTFLLLTCGTQPVRGGIDIELFNPSVTSEHLTLVFPPQLQLRISQEKAEDVRWSEDNEKLVLTPDHETLLGSRNVVIRFRPVIFKCQHKGFRVISGYAGTDCWGDIPDVTYIAFSDTPMNVGEDDVEMVKDGGKLEVKDKGKRVIEGGEWVKIEDSKSLILDKLGWTADVIIRQPDFYIENSENRAKYLSDPHFGPIIRTLAEHGFITLPPDEPDGETPPDIPEAEPETQPSDENPQANDDDALVVEDETSCENTIPRRPISRAWLWLLALPAAAGAVWLLLRHATKRN